jgi:Zn-dependent peptidase ImmA (M78 family)
MALSGAPVSPLVEDLLPRVVKVMGLPAPKNLKVKLISRTQAEAILRRDVEKDRDHLERLGEALIAIGLIPPDTKLATLAPDFNRQNVSGFYDLKEHTLFLLTDQTDEAQRPIIAHELAHAVQDANADLQRAMSGSEDATLAFTAVLEGQAQATAALVMDDWLRDQRVAVEGMAGLLSDTTAQSAAEAAEHAPIPWLGLQLRFPYVAGRQLVAARASPADPIARGLLQHPPTSTAEVMAPTKSLAPREARFTSRS